jgi:hypothetical protein
MDKRFLLAFGMGAATLALGIVVVRLLGLGSGVPPIDVGHTEPPRRINDLSGPYTYKNLTVYLVHGENELTGRTPLTLEEAMDRKLVRVHETSEVNELEIENISSSEEVFVQAGDIVKGGKQDRVLAVDLIVPARSRRMPINSFCVEHGRWTARGDESDREFNSAVGGLPSKDLKIAAMHSNSQTEVWENVEKTQSKLSAASNTNVASPMSRSSLQLSLENQAVRNSAEDYIDVLRTITAGKPDLIGFVFAINGEINSGDVYGSNELFEKLWPKLLKATAIEAVGESYGNEKAEAVEAYQMQDFLEEAEKGRSTGGRRVTDRIRIETRESRRAVFSESTDSIRDSWLHRNYITK